MIALVAVGSVAEVRREVGDALKKARAAQPESAALYAALSDDVAKRLHDMDGEVMVSVECRVVVEPVDGPTPAVEVALDDEEDSDAVVGEIAPLAHIEHTRLSA